MLVFVCFLLVAFAGIVICLFRPFNPDNSRLCGRLFGKVCLPLLGVRLEVEGLHRLENFAPSVVVANHLSNLDLFVFGSVIPPRTVSVGKKSLRYLPLFGQVYWLAGNIMIDRSNRDRSINAMDEISAAMMSRRSSIWIFPEGTRSQGKHLGAFKKGAFHIAIQTQAPIMPICASNYPVSIQLKEWRSGTVKIAILPPIATKGLEVSDIDQLMDKTRTQMESTIARLDAEVASLR
ncbi:MAG: 1-acylglycerol-3-phosphate O-acyltransferase [Oleiphilaceae bacterium]|nr:1-acylglycerol-3-phosphate O-acyltransferase [Oleiphilaceae bacterium]